MPRTHHTQILSTGLPSLDRVFRGLMPGDNIVWQIDTVEDYLPFVEPYAEYAVRNRQRLIYFRFADHPALLQPQDGISVVELDPNEGFESFLDQTHSIIGKADRGTLYLFDCLSKLAPDWNSDRMLGNFFMLTCPYLYDRAAIAFFSIQRNYHSFHAVTPITQTTQILVDAYRRNGQLYIQPRKVQHRHSHTMYMLHVMRDGEFHPVTQSAEITATLAGAPWSQADSTGQRRGYWTRTFAEAEELQAAVEAGETTVEPGYLRHLLRMLITRQEPLLGMAERYFSLDDILAIRRRMIGTGMIGGKAVGMLLARAILCRVDPRWKTLLEPHDSFYVGADVFYTYLVQNGCWWMMQRHKLDWSDDETETARRRMLAGEFPAYIVEQFERLLDYFGQSPIIVRSSSLLEDNFGNAFAGKYESVFCANQGGHHKRLEDFLCAVRTVYASSMGEAALAYRQKRGLINRDEQMALLIQRVSGDSYGHLFFPQAAGVGFSFNPYVWHDTIDPRAGMLRLVFGVGTRAVDRADDDYTRVVALNEPMRRPEANVDKVRQYAQRRVDVLDMEANQLTSMRFADVVKQAPQVPMDYFASRDLRMERETRRHGRSVEFPWVITFDRLLSETPFVEDMRALLQCLQEAYSYPVDVEFTLNFFRDGAYNINVVQCRPLQVMEPGETPPHPGEIPEGDTLLLSRGAVIGQSLHAAVDWVLYVRPEVYGTLGLHERHEVARAIGEVVRAPALRDKVLFLLGPGRWCTTSPELGVPVTFAEIANVSIVCEIVAMRENLVPDVSLGTHFFNELVENNMLYLAYFPRQEGNVLRGGLLEDPALNRRAEFVAGNEPWMEALRVVRAPDIRAGKQLHFFANALEQQALCYLRGK